LLAGVAAFAAAEAVEVRVIPRSIDVLGTIGLLLTSCD
jgi:hypothetical protein